MPAIQRGQAYRLGPHRWGLRYYDGTGSRRRKSPFPSKSAALIYYLDVIEPQVRGEPAPTPELTLAELVDLYLERHAATVRLRTIATLRERLRHATAAFGNVPLRDLERMASEIAGWRARQPERVRHARLGALRQVLDAAVRWGYASRNPAKIAGRNPKPAPRAVRAFTPDELDAIAAELPPAFHPLPRIAAATGLRPEEWQALERQEVDKRERVLRVRRSVSSGQVVDLGKTSRSRRQVPLSARAARGPRSGTAPTRYPAALSGHARWGAEPRQLAPPRLGACHRGVCREAPGEDLRHAVDIRLRRARGRRVGVRARADHGHIDRDDRATLWDAARRRRRGHRGTSGRA
jgi:hypothetical protein